VSFESLGLRDAASDGREVHLEVRGEHFDENAMLSDGVRFEQARRNWGLFPDPASTAYHHIFPCSAHYGYYQGCLTPCEGVNQK
jgi:hypothetical protein